MNARATYLSSLRRATSNLESSMAIRIPGRDGDDLDERATPPPTPPKQAPTRASAFIPTTNPDEDEGSEDETAGSGLIP